MKGALRGDREITFAPERGKKTGVLDKVANFSDSWQSGKFQKQMKFKVGKITKAAKAKTIRTKQDAEEETDYFGATENIVQPRGDPGLWSSTDPKAMAVSPEFPPSDMSGSESGESDTVAKEPAYDGVSLEALERAPVAAPSRGKTTKELKASATTTAPAPLGASGKSAPAPSAEGSRDPWADSDEEPAAQLPARGAAAKESPPARVPAAKSAWDDSDSDDGGSPQAVAIAGKSPESGGSVNLAPPSASTPTNKPKKSKAPSVGSMETESTIATAKSSSSKTGTKKASAEKSSKGDKSSKGEKASTSRSKALAKGATTPAVKPTTIGKQTVPLVKSAVSSRWPAAESSDEETDIKF